MVLEISHGPWKEIFAGDWGGYEIHLFENPDKLLLSAIYEKKGAEGGGTVLILNRFYLVEGDASKLMQGLGGYSLVFEKNDPVRKLKFVSISSGPYYSAAQDIGKTFEEVFKSVEETAAKLNDLGKSHGTTLHELKYAPSEAARLFSEPLIIFGALCGKEVEDEFRIRGTVPLGKRKDGIRAEENVENFLNTLILGEKEFAKRQMQILLENCAISGITAVVFDDENAFEGMENPNRTFLHEEYPELQPAGMPLRSFSPEGLGINLKYFGPQMFCEMLGIEALGEGDYIGKPIAELFTWVFEKKKFSSLKEMQNLILSAEETKKYPAQRAFRMLSLFGLIHPSLLNGETDINKFLVGYVRGMGTIIRVDTKGLSDNLKAALIYSFMRSLVEQPQKTAKVMCFALNGDRIVPYLTKTETQKEFLMLLLQCFQKGIGFCTSAQYEIDLNPQVVCQSTVKLEYVKENEAAIREKNSRPYRIMLRPTLSG